MSDTHGLDDAPDLLRSHLPFAVALVRQLAQEMESADLDDPAERKALAVMLDFAVDAARAAESLIHGARACRALRLKAARPGGLVTKDAKRLATLQEDEVVRSVAQSLDDDPEYAAHVEGSAALVLYTAKGMRKEIDRAARNGRT